MNRAELKAKAKNQIAGKIGILFLITLIIGAISFGVGMIPVIGSVASILLPPAFAISICRVYLGLVRGTDPTVNDAFSGFNDLWSAFKVYFLVALFTFLWSMLFYIPGIVKALSYSMAFYIQAENPEKPALECIEESKTMTQGYKMDLFVLGLSFIGWLLLCSITFGIAYIWVGPYMQATYTNAYEYLKGQKPSAF